MVYTPSALSLVSAMRADTGLDETRPGLRDLPDRDGTSERSYDVQYLARDGRVAELRQRAPDMPPFTDAFSAFARGTLITTADGPVAVEDLVPGMKILTTERGPSPILWIGSMTLRSDACAQDHGGPRLIRVMPDTLGPGRPMADVMAGPGARILHRGPGGERALRPVRDMIDGMGAVALRPPGAVRLFHLMLPRHATITAAGLEAETFHPGPGFDQTMDYRALDRFLALFPHIARPSDFGSLAHPRRPLRRGRDVA